MVEPGLQPRASEKRADTEGAEWSPKYRTQEPGVSEGCVQWPLLHFDGLWIECGWGSCLLHCVWGSDEGVSEGKQKWILETKGGQLRTHSQVLEVLMPLTDQEWRKMKEAGEGNEEEQGPPTFTLSCHLEFEERSQRRGFDRKSLSKKQPHLRTQMGFLLSRVPSVTVTQIHQVS